MQIEALSEFSGFMTKLSNKHRRVTPVIVHRAMQNLSSMHTYFMYVSPKKHVKMVRVCQGKEPKHSKPYTRMWTV